MTEYCIDLVDVHYGVYQTAEPYQTPDLVDVHYGVYQTAGEFIADIIDFSFFSNVKYRLIQEETIQLNDPAVNFPPHILFTELANRIYLFDFVSVKIIPTLGGSVEGFVYNTGLYSIPNAAVHVIKMPEKIHLPEYFTTTDENGYFKIENLPYGDYVIVIFKPFHTIGFAYVTLNPATPDQYFDCYMYLLPEIFCTDRVYDQYGNMFKLYVFDDRIDEEDGMRHTKVLFAFGDLYNSAYIEDKAPYDGTITVRGEDVQVNILSAPVLGVRCFFDSGELLTTVGNNQIKFKGNIRKLDFDGVLFEIVSNPYYPFYIDIDINKLPVLRGGGGGGGGSSGGYGSASSGTSGYGSYAASGRGGSGGGWGGSGGGGSWGGGGGTGAGIGAGGVIHPPDFIVERKPNQIVLVDVINLDEAPVFLNFVDYIYIREGSQDGSESPLEFKPYIQVIGRAIDIYGNPIPYAFVYAYVEDYPYPIDKAVTDSNGIYTLNYIPSHKKILIVIHGEGKGTISGWIQTGGKNIVFKEALDILRNESFWSLGIYFDYDATYEFPALLQGYGRIYGHVWELGTGRPVANAVIEVEGTDLRVVTDSDGYYSVWVKTKGEFNVKCVKEGYKRARGRAIISSDYQLDFYLEKSVSRAYTGKTRKFSLGKHKRLKIPYLKILPQIPIEDSVNLGEENVVINYIGKIPLEDSISLSEQTVQVTVITPVGKLRVANQGTVSEGYYHAVHVDGDYMYACGRVVHPSLATNVGEFAKFDLSDLSRVFNACYGGTNTRFHDVAGDNDYLYIVGQTSAEGLGYEEAILYKVSKQDGSVVARIRAGGTNTDMFTGVVCDDNYVYVVGYSIDGSTYSRDLTILKFDKNLNVVAQKKCEGIRPLGRISRIAQDTDYIYVACYNSWDYRGAVMKISKSDLSRVAMIQIRPVIGGTDYPAELLGIDVDANYVYVSGHAWTGSSDYMLVAKLNKSDLSLNTAKIYSMPSSWGTAHVLKVDDNYVYVTHGYGGYSGGISKFDKSDLSFVAGKYLYDPNNKIDGWCGLDFYGDYLVLVGGKEVFSIMLLDKDLQSGTIASDPSGYELRDFSQSLVSSSVLTYGTGFTYSDLSLTVAASTLSTCTSLYGWSDLYRFTT